MHIIHNPGSALKNLRILTPKIVSKLSEISVPDPDPHVFFISRIRILLSLSKNSKTNRDFYIFVTSFWFFIFENWCKSTFKK